MKKFNIICVKLFISTKLYRRKRALLAITTNDEPQIIILDEPTANLDSDLAEKVIKEIINLYATTDTTFLIATHDISLIEDGNRVIILEDGKIKSDGFVITPKLN